MSETEWGGDGGHPPRSQVICGPRTGGRDSAEPGGTPRKKPSPLEQPVQQAKSLWSVGAGLGRPQPRGPRRPRTQLIRRRKSATKPHPAPAPGWREGAYTRREPAPSGAGPGPSGAGPRTRCGLARRGAGRRGAAGGGEECGLVVQRGCARQKAAAVPPAPPPRSPVSAPPWRSAGLLRGGRSGCLRCREWDGGCGKGHRLTAGCGASEFPGSGLDLGKGISGNYEKESDV